MKLRVGLIVFCVFLYVGASVCSLTNSNDDVQKLAYGTSGFGLELILAKLEAMEYRLQKMESMQLQLQKIEDEIQKHRSSQEQSKEEILSVLHKLENQIVFNLSEVHNRDQEKVNTALHKLDRDVENVRNVSQQIMNALPKQPPYSSCKDAPWFVSRTYLIRVKSDSEPFRVYCEQESFGGGWIVFQHRYDGSLDFYRGWNDFRDGFGDLNKEFWLGLEKLHQITNGRKHELIVELKDFNGTYKYARYGEFEIGNESDQYYLKEIRNYGGTAGDAMSYNKGNKFSTKDRDNDDNRGQNCAQYYEGGWWYYGCSYVNLNGRYVNANDQNSMHWYTFNGWHRLSYSRMMIRELE